jgi:hypothetical protein
MTEGGQLSLPQRPHSLFTMSLSQSPRASSPRALQNLAHYPDGAWPTSRRRRALRRARRRQNAGAGWWRQTGSNRRPHACKARALPAELCPLTMVGLGRLERPTSPLSGVRSNHLSYRPRKDRSPSARGHQPRRRPVDPPIRIKEKAKRGRLMSRIMGL